MKPPVRADDGGVGAGPHRESGRREAVKNDIAPQAPPVQTWLRREAQSVFATKESNKRRSRAAAFFAHPGTFAAPYPQSGIQYFTE